MDSGGNLKFLVFPPLVLNNVFDAFCQSMGSYPVGDHRHTGFQKNLYTMQKSSGQLLPKVELKHGEVRRVSNNPVGGSAAFDIWVGEYLGQEKCAIKVVRGIEVSPKIRDVGHFLYSLGFNLIFFFS